MHKFYDTIGIDMYSLVKDIAALDETIVKIEVLSTGSFRRESTDKTLEEVLEIARNDKFAHWVFINRKHRSMGFLEPNRLETGVSTLHEDGNTYFIFVYGDENLVQEYAKKYGIIPVEHNI